MAQTENPIAAKRETKSGAEAETSEVHRAKQSPSASTREAQRCIMAFFSFLCVGKWRKRFAGFLQMTNFQQWRQHFSQHGPVDNWSIAFILFSAKSATCKKGKCNRKRKGLSSSSTTTHNSQTTRQFFFFVARPLTLLLQVFCFLLEDDLRSTMEL